MKPKGSVAPTYFKHLGIYAYRHAFLLQYGKLPETPLQKIEDLEQLKVLEAGYKIKVVQVGQSSPCVDIPEDIQRVEKWLCTQNISL
jgi:3-deoxy-manno-octulosonate cytidylyltransferase (CMP-KDO synthetase)